MSACSTLAARDSLLCSHASPLITPTGVAAGAAAVTAVWANVIAENGVKQTSAMLKARRAGVFFILISLQLLIQLLR